MPKLLASDTDTPRRRRGAVAIDDSAERGRLMQLVLRSPKDLVAAMAAAAAVIAIISNALFMQAGRHPAPMFGAAEAPVANPLPRPRPIEAFAKPAETRAGEIRAIEPRLLAPPAPAKPGAAALPPAAAASAPVARPPAAVPSRTDPVGDLITSSRRVAAVQRALTDFGYGQLKPTGTVGSETMAAIQKFERDRKIPVTGQMSERLVRELSAMTGRPIE